MKKKTKKLKKTLLLLQLKRWICFQILQINYYYSVNNVRVNNQHIHMNNVHVNKQGGSPCNENFQMDFNLWNVLRNFVFSGKICHFCEIQIKF